jgi:hypothetical protein
LSSFEFGTLVFIFALLLAGCCRSKSIHKGNSFKKRLELFLSWLDTLPMPPEEVEKLMAELSAWCEAKYGRQSELADKLGVSKQLVANWLAGRRALTLKHYFAIQGFLKDQKRESK